MKHFILFLSPLLLGACVGTTRKLEVKQFHFRDETLVSTDEPMIRMEKLRRLHGAVTAIERRERLGQYFTLLWNDSDGVGDGEVEVVFQYQQGASASKVKRMSKRFPASDAAGIVEFAVIGGDYFKGGKVLTWKATVFRGTREIGSKQSYLWR
ncbi:MAG: hypothetical protein ACRCXD_05845 [Luteolibacter sp.]